MEISAELKKALLLAQKGEITEFHVYQNMAKRIKDDHNRQVVQEISADEKKHYEIWKQYTGKDVKPNGFRIWLFTTISRLFGLTFGFKLMERREERAQTAYAEVFTSLPESAVVMADEKKHEMELLNMLDEEALVYAGSVVLGLNDALVELTGALAGLTLAFRDVNTIALSGLVTGIAASLSMAASEYLSTGSEETEKNPIRAAIYTGIAYVVTVALLILPFLLLHNAYIALAISITTSVAIIALFNFYISVAKDLPFGKRFFEMAGLSLGVAAFSFLVGYVLSNVFGVGG
jgi:VIT1/CCC1 family predicted Fe2+/Mn2+ transporter